MSSFAYFPYCGEDIRAMLERIGVKSLDELYSDVPSDCLYKGEYELPEALSEQEVRAHFEALASKNVPLKVFVGQGAYDHYTPSVVPYILSRSEFLTAYTPYQCEISQGTLRYIFEYQSMICNLTGLDVSNASLYDGPTAAAEAVMMASSSVRGKSKVLLSEGLLPQVRKVVETYAGFHGVPLGYIPLKDSETSLEGLKEALEAGDVAAIVVPQINRLGVIEDHSGFAEMLHEGKGLVIEYCDPSALGVLKTPAEDGADIAVGDAQSLGIPLTYGGPYVGFMAVRNELLRKMPGRIVGQTIDREGKRAYVLTLQAREQHIRREKATSNICSNQSLMALFVTVYLSLMGPEGLREVNELSAGAAHYLKEGLLATGLFEDPCAGKPFLKEFALKPKGDAAKLHKALLEKGFFAALPSEEGYVLFSATEKRSKEEIDALIKAVKEAEL